MGSIFSREAKKEVAMIKANLGPIQEFDLSKLQEHPENRKMFPIESEDYFNSVLESMQEVGQIDPIIVRQDGVVVCGNNRMNAARTLGWTKIEGRPMLGPVLTEEKERASS